MTKRDRKEYLKGNTKEDEENGRKGEYISPAWQRVEDGLPMNKQNLLFVVHTPPYHHTELGEMPDTKKVVYGSFSQTPRYGRRWWSFEDEFGECVICNEYAKENDGEETYITHWMPLPEPPKEEP